MTNQYTKREWPIDLIRKLVEVEGKKHWEVGELIGTTAKQIHKICKRSGIKSQRRGPRSGEGHPDWKGGRTVDKDGYVQIYSPGHPHAKKPVPYVLEHRLVMEKHIGRYLTRKEVVHHINKNKQDNRIENLELFENNGHHLRKELKGKCPNWSEEGKAKILRAVMKRKKNHSQSKPDAP